MTIVEGSETSFTMPPALSLGNVGIIFLAAVLSIRTKTGTALLFLLASSIRLFGIATMGMKGLRIIDISWWTEYLNQFGIAASTVLLSFALGVRIRDLQKEAHDADLRAAESAKPQKIDRKARDQFLATMSHEIRTPLSGILNALEFIRDRDVSGSSN